jgi:hypothetical protein
MVLSVSTIDGKTLKFRTENFYFEVDKISDTNKWVELANACKNNDIASIHWKTQYNTVEICVSTGMVTFQSNKSNDANQKDDYIVKMLYQLSANECEKVFQKAATL